MTDEATEGPVPADFEAAVASLRAVVPRPELTVTEMTAPVGLAPRSIAITADVHPRAGALDSVLGTGRFVLLHDPGRPESWGGAFRVVCYSQAPLEPDIGTDPFVADVAWSWLVDALDSRRAGYAAASGTATKNISTGYGELAGQVDGAELELRASWSPLDEHLGEHLSAWLDLLCLLAGLPPTTDGVSLLSLRRPGRE